MSSLDKAVALQALARGLLLAADELVAALTPVEPPAPVPPPAPNPPPPPPAPPPTDTSGYRYAQPTLWTRVDQAQAPSRVPGGSPLPLDRVGPTHRMVSARVGWPWRRAGGDWIDAAGALHGSVAWASLPLNAASGPTASADYSIDVTAAIQHIVASGRHCALYLRAVGAPRVMAGDGSPRRPVLTVTYADGATESLRPHVLASIDASVAHPNTTAAECKLPAMVEFKRPRGDATRAMLSFTVTQHWSGAGQPRLEVFLVDPPVNAEPVQHGIAAAAPLDASVPTHPSVIGAHRITDETTLADIAEGAVPTHLANFNALRAYDPALYGVGPEDKTLLPHRSLGKWIGAGRNWSIVRSDYTAEGFRALAPGVGAVRILYPREVDRDGAIVGYARSTPVSAKIFMPPEHFGKLREIFVRYYLRLGTPDGGPYIFDPSTRYQVHAQEGAAAKWTDCAGKIGIMPAHDTTKGGVSGTSGGGRGWQMRMAWSEVDLPAGPDTGGIGAFLHWHDFQDNVPGHNYQGGQGFVAGDDSLAQRGGLGGMFYAHRWYCIETRLRLNSVDRPATLPDGSPHVIAGVPQFWTPDGELDVWIDGRLAYSKSGLVMRSLPRLALQGMDRNVYLPAAAELGIRDLWLNWFHGGLTKSSRDRVLFFSQLAWGTEYIGPMMR